MHNLTIIDITKQTQREAYIKLFDAGKGMTLSLVDLFSFVSIKDMFGAIQESRRAVSDILFYKKVSGFLEEVEKSNVTDHQIENFKLEIRAIDNFEQKIHEYLLNLINNAESEDKARIMGYIYVAAVSKNIDADMMLRLCSIVNRIYIGDLYELPKYVASSGEDSVAANNFIASGLIDSYVGGYWVDAPSYKLNSLGETLYNILNQNKWFK